MLVLKQIVVAIDFTEVSDAAFDYAVDLAARLGARLTVVHTYELPILGLSDGMVIAAADTSFRVAEAARAGLAAAVQAREGRGVELTAVLREGVAWDEINIVADEVDADLIVIGTHGRKGLARALLGSIAEHVIRAATRPVLTIHAPHHPTTARAAPHAERSQASGHGRS
jgi:nucleotide-binding universal stress UspA family protein